MGGIKCSMEMMPPDRMGGTVPTYGHDAARLYGRDEPDHGYDAAVYGRHDSDHMANMPLTVWAVRARSHGDDAT